MVSKLQIRTNPTVFRAITISWEHFHHDSIKRNTSLCPLITKLGLNLIRNIPKHTAILRRGLKVLISQVNKKLNPLSVSLGWSKFYS